MKKRALSSALAFLAGVLSVSGYISAEGPGVGCELMAGVAIRLRKNKGNLFCFFGSWLTGVIGFILFLYIGHKYY